MIKQISFTCALAVTVATVLADSSNDELRIRVVNAHPASSPITVSLGAQQLFSSVPYGKITSYKPILASEDNANLSVETAEGTKLHVGRDELEDDEYYTVLVMATGSGGNEPHVKILDVDDDRPADIKAHIFLINASPIIDPVELGVDGDRLFSGVSSGQLSGPASIDVGQRKISLSQTGEGKTLLNVPLNIEATKTYTVVVFNDQDVSIVDDSSPMKSLTSRTPPETTSSVTGSTSTRVTDPPAGFQHN